MALPESGEKTLEKTPIASLCSFLLDNEQRGNPQSETEEGRKYDIKYKSLSEAFGNRKELMRFIQLEHLPNTRWANEKGNKEILLYNLMQGEGEIKDALRTTQIALLLQREAASQSKGIHRSVSAVRDIFRREPDEVILNELKQVNDQLDKVNALIKVEDLIIEWFESNKSSKGTDE